jgi:hypothetical protein
MYKREEEDSSRRIKKDSSNYLDKEITIVVPRISKKAWNAMVLVIVIAFLSISSMYTFGLLSSRNLLSSDETANTTGVTANVDIGLFQDQECTKNFNSINWGIIYPGENKTWSAYIQNQGNVKITLQMETLNWRPQIASEHLTLTWNYQNQTLKKDEVIEVTWTLTSTMNITEIETFSVDIIIRSFG